jgi:hypothetical protein
MKSNSWGVVLIVAGCLCRLSVGCGLQSSGQERFIPAPAAATATIARALDAWKRGEPPGEVTGTKPVVFVVDTYRREGQTLESFDILGEVAGLTQRTYLIRLRFSNPASEEKVRYSVIGIDPLWVYRHEDLELLTHWEHKMPEPVAEREP